MKNMKTIPFLCIAGAATIVAGCKSTKASQSQIPVMPISTNTVTSTIHTQRIDTVLVTVPAQTAERTTTDKSSRLSTDYAESYACINADGTLTHTLHNLPAPLPVAVTNTSDTILVDKIIEKPVAVEVPIEVERQPTWWEKMRLATWGWLAAIVALCAAWIFRTPLLTLLRRLLLKAL